MNRYAFEKEKCEADNLYVLGEAASSAFELSMNSCWFEQYFLLEIVFNMIFYEKIDIHLGIRNRGGTSKKRILDIKKIIHLKQYKDCLRVFHLWVCHTKYIKHYAELKL